MAKKVLVLDDDNYIVELISYALKKDKYEVCTSNDGIRALETAAKEKPDLIILDLMVPKIDGMQVCEELEKNN